LYTPKVIADILASELRPAFSQQRIMVLDVQQLIRQACTWWPNFSAASDDSHVLSLIVMVNEKFAKQRRVASVCRRRGRSSPRFSNRAIALIGAGWQLPFPEQAQLALFLVNSSSASRTSLCVP